MAKRAALGVMQFGNTPTAVGEITSFSYSAEANEIDTTIMGTGNSRFIPGAVRHTFELEVMFEFADVGQALLIANLGVSTAQTATIMPLGVGSGLPRATGSFYVMSNNFNAEASEAQKMTMTLTSDENGAAWSAQP